MLNGKVAQRATLSKHTATLRGTGVQIARVRGYSRFEARPDFLFVVDPWQRGFGAVILLVLFLFSDPTMKYKRSLLIIVVSDWCSNVGARRP